MATDMTKTILIILGIFILLGAAGTTIIMMGNEDEVAVGIEFKTPIFCNDYEFTCCNEHVDSTTSYTVTDEKPWQCPPWASKCEILSVSADNVASGFEEWGVGSLNCAVQGFVCSGFECVSERLQATEMKPNDYVWFDHPCLNTKGTMQIKVYKRRLDFTGGAASTTGIPVLGADQCHFNPEFGTVYDPNSGQKIQQTSQTVPLFECMLSYQAGNRHICGYAEETCQMDSDCGGHTYGNFECIGRTLQEYGCREFGTPEPFEQDRLPSDSNWGRDSSQVLFGSRCEIKSAKQVQCCGDNDCGNNFFCDRDTWTCKEEVECIRDTDCGVSEQCDFTIPALKKPTCNSGICGFDETQVDCCSDVNCPSGQFCDANKECKVRQAACTECPYECCIDSCGANGGFLDRACGEDKPFCIDNACQAEEDDGEECGAWLSFPEFEILGETYGGGTILPNLFCIINNLLSKFIIWFSVVVGLIGGAMGISYLLRFLPKGSTTKTKVIYSIITFLLLGVALFALALIFFWWILLFIVIISIARAVIPGV